MPLSWLLGEYSEPISRSMGNGQVRQSHAFTYFQTSSPNHFQLPVLHTEVTGINSAF